VKTSEAQDFFTGYAKAFSDMDVDEVCARWSYPAFMAARGKQATLDEAAFRTNTVAQCDFYRAQGVARAEKQVLELVRLTETTSRYVRPTPCSTGRATWWRPGSTSTF
jgi:hypothetical protein